MTIRGHGGLIGFQRLLDALDGVVEILAGAGKAYRARCSCLVVERLGDAQHARTVDRALRVALDPLALGRFSQRVSYRLPFVRRECAHHRPVDVKAAARPYDHAWLRQPSLLEEGV